MSFIRVSCAKLQLGFFTAKDLPCQQAVRARSYPHPPRANLVVVFGIAKNIRLAPEALDYM